MSKEWGREKGDYYLLKEHMFDIMLSKESISKRNMLENCRRVWVMQGGKILKKLLDELLTHVKILGLKHRTIFVRLRKWLKWVVERIETKLEPIAKVTKKRIIFNSPEFEGIRT